MVDINKEKIWTILDSANVEVWRNIDGYEGIYQISNLGNVKSLDRYTISPRTGNTLLKKGKQLNPRLRNGYCSVCLYKPNKKRKVINVHRLAAKIFIPNNLTDELPIINHKNGVKTDNRIVNLEWSNISLNTQHAYEKGLIKLTPKAKEVRRNNIKKAVERCKKSVTCVETCVKYDSAIEAAYSTGLKGSSSIIRACKDIKKTAAGYHWKYTE